ncbi:hypothetical protein Pla22_35890 [Rubripirellula amarantea]|uniref:Uncharacterized protein n=1 Tax=Rubripirellula amarantea TaxID=2527999 RepID=A0A5C5WJ90_9BACT|nr:hypothetical protein Pla22_35890 [Rubripirellula amarantea]
MLMDAARLTRSLAHYSSFARTRRIPLLSDRLKQPMTDDETFLAEFEGCRWPLSRWHHRDHIKLAYLYLCRYSFGEALSRIRDGIKAHNAAHQLPDSSTSGFHETMTHAWLCLVQFAIAEYGPSANADDFYENHPELSQQKTLRFFYSKERFMSPEAKTRFCEPDLTPFPIGRGCKGKDSQTETPAGGSGET